MLNLMAFLSQVIIMIITAIVLLYSTPEEIKRGVKFDLTLANDINLIKAFVLHSVSITIPFSILFIVLTIFFHNITWALLPDYWFFYPIILAIGLVVIVWRVIAAFRHSAK